MESLGTDEFDQYMGATHSLLLGAQDGKGIQNADQGARREVDEALRPTGAQARYELHATQ
jgi:hypothetical protein